LTVDANIHIESPNINDYQGARVRAIILDEEKGIKALYAQSDCTIISYIFRKSRNNWDVEKAQAWSDEHKREFIKYGHLSVDQDSEFLRVVGHRQDETTKDFLPSSPSFIFKREGDILFYDTTTAGSGEKEHNHGVVELDLDGNGETVENGGHIHKVIEFVFQPAEDHDDDHIHELDGLIKGEKPDEKKEDVGDMRDKSKTDTGTDVLDKKEDNMTNDNVEVDISEGLEIVKVDDDRRLLYGVFLWPEKADHDGDVISVKDIEMVAHGFMADYRKVDEMHNQIIEADIVESALAWEDNLKFFGKTLDKGTWFGAIKVHDDIVWAKVKDGTYKGFSVRISGVREPIAQ
jgi:hypothetical protein